MIETKLSGIIKRDVEVPMRAAIADIIGRNIITTGVLFVKALVRNTAAKAASSVGVG
jgi:hypothetical protein